MWGFLQEFWNAITQVGDYTIEWFQNIGLAVAGAVGNLFDFVLHYINDIAVFFYWIFSILGDIIGIFLLPLTYIFNFLKSLIQNAFATPDDFSYNWSTDILSIFEAIPYWTTITSVIGTAIIVFAVFFVIHSFHKA